MPNVSKLVADIGDGVTVRYSALKRTDRNVWEIMFLKPDGNRKRITTAHELRPKVKEPPDELHLDAVKLIRAVYFPERTEFPDIKTPITWAEALDRVEANVDVRSETMRGYRSAVKAFTKIIPECTGPTGVTDDRVSLFLSEFLSKKYKSSKTGKPRSPRTLSYYVRSLSGLTGHLMTPSLRIVSKNPWQDKDGDIAQGEKKAAYVPDDDEADQFFAWVRSLYPDWHSLHALLETKALVGCRSADICQLRKSDLAKGKLTFPADIIKTKEDRVVPLPPDLFQSLTEATGETYLWERLFREIPKYRKMSNGIPESFSWKTVYFVVNNIFRKYAKTFPERPRLTAHSLRRRAVTQVTKHTGSTDKAATWTGMTPENARRIYLDAQQAFDRQEILDTATASLRPKQPGNYPPIIHQNGKDTSETI